MGVFIQILIFFATLSLFLGILKHFVNCTKKMEAEKQYWIDQFRSKESEYFHLLKYALEEEQEERYLRCQLVAKEHCFSSREESQKEGKKSSKQNKSRQSNIKPLPQGWIRAYVDGACPSNENGGGKEIGVGIVFQQADGKFLPSFSELIARTTEEKKVFFAEANAVLCALQKAQTMKVSGIQILSDNKGVVDKIYNNASWSSTIKSINTEKEHFSEGFLVEWIPKEENRQAHNAARRVVLNQNKNKTKQKTKKQNQNRLPAIADDVAWLINCQDPLNQDLRKLRVNGGDSGRDSFSDMNQAQLWEAVLLRHGKNEREFLKAELRKNGGYNSNGALKVNARVALRWCARGLPAQLALKKAFFSEKKMRSNAK